VERQSHWEHVYDTKQQDEVSWFEHEPSTSLELIDACGLDRDDGIIDVGGGASRLVDGLLARGYGALGVLDIAGSALRVARERLGAASHDVSWFEEDVTAFDPPREWGLWHDRAVFHFLTEAADREAYLRVLERSLAPGGWVVLATFAADGPSRCSGLDVVRYDQDALLAELGAGFTLHQAVHKVHTTPSGAEQRLLYARFQRAV
jgi:SAM-dependent methyltransferase